MKKLSERLQERLEGIERQLSAFGLAPANLTKDHQYFILSECLELARSFEAAPVRVVKTYGEPDGYGAPINVQSVIIGYDMDGAIIPSLEGKRVRIVPEREG